MSSATENEYLETGELIDIVNEVSYGSFLVDSACNPRFITTIASQNMDRQAIAEITGG